MWCVRAGKNWSNTYWQIVSDFFHPLQIERETKKYKKSVRKQNHAKGNVKVDDDGFSCLIWNLFIWKKLLFMFELKRHVFCLIFIMGFEKRRGKKLFATMKNRQLYLKSFFFIFPFAAEHFSLHPLSPRGLIEQSSSRTIMMMKILY